MPNHDPKPPDGDSTRPDNYPNHPDSATPSLKEKLLQKIKGHGSLPFYEFMETALYDPAQGYYAKSEEQVGRDGDFFTSVSVGPLFGQLLARRFLKWWEEHGQPEVWRILELGAHDGKLAADILSTILKLSPPAWKSLEYAIAEPLALLRQAQSKRLENLASQLLIRPSLEEVSSTRLPGIAFSNEVLDALPFHLVRMTADGWKELHVASSEDEFTFLPRSIPPESELATKLQTLGTNFPENYQTELRTNFPAFLQSVSQCLSNGFFLFIDYGFAAPEYYDTHRTTGTLRTFSKHTAAENPLDRPGEIDITAHVDFTDLARAAAAINYQPAKFTNQGSYLTHLAKPLILDGGLADQKSIAQFQTLTHPAHLGAKFHAIELNKNAEISATTEHRLAL